MLRQIRLHNFKAFEDLTVEVRPLTVFLGPNNSGKSSILSCLRLLAQTIESGDSGIALLLDGVMGNFGTYGDIVYANKTRRHIRIGLSFEFEEKDNRQSISLDLVFKYRSVRREVILQGVTVLVDGSHFLTTHYSNESGRQTIDKVWNKDLTTPAGASLSKTIVFENFLPRNFYLGLKGQRVTEFVSERGVSKLRRNVSVLGAVSSFLHSIEYVGAMRMPPMRSYTFSGERRHHIGSKGEHTVTNLAMDGARSGSKSMDLTRKATDWLKKAGLASEIKLRRFSEGPYELRMQHPVTGEYENFADVGYGNSQVLPVLVAGLGLAPKATFIVEQPEIHLHPSAQAELGDFFRDLYQDKVQCLVETHSEHLILRLQQHVADGVIPADDLRIYYVHAVQEGKQVIELGMDSEGYFLNEPPEGFFPEGLEEATNLARIRYKKKTEREKQKA